MDVRQKSLFVFFCLVGMICSASSQGQDTEPELRYACWGSFGPPVVSAQCPRNTVIQVRRAGLKVRSGRGHCTFSEEDCGCEFGEAGCNMPDVRKQCMGRSACRLDVTQQYIDSQTCRGFSDYMFIQFSCVNVRRGADHDICSTIATSQEQGFLHSPEYPHVYPKNRLCECSLNTSPGDVISMSLLDFHAEDNTCQHSNLVLAHDGQKEQVCSSSQNQVLVAGSNKIQLLFETDDYGGNGGFWLKYETLPTTSVKISCRSVYKPPPSTTSTTAVVQTPESTTWSSHEAETRTVMSQQQTTTSPPPPKRQPPKRRRRPQPTQESVPSSTLMMTSEANEPRPKPIFRRGDTNNNEGNKYHKLHVESRKVPPVPKPTPWWWKFTMSPAAEQPANTNLKEVYSTEREIDLQDNNVVNADIDEAIRQSSYDSPNNNNKISVLGSGWRPDPDPLPTQPRPILPDKLVPTPQDKLPDMKTDGVDPSSQPHANVFAPPESPADTNKGKLLSPISVKIRPGSFLSNTRTRTHPRGGSPYYLREFSHVLTQRQGIDKPPNPKLTHNDQLRNPQVGKMDSGTILSKAVGRKTYGKKPHMNKQREKLIKPIGLLPNAENSEIKIKTTEQDVSKIKVSEHETSEWKKAEYGHLGKPYRNNWRWSSSDGTLSHVPALLGHIKDTIDRKHLNTAETIGSRKASIRDTDTDHKEIGVSGKDVLSVFRIDTYSKPAPTQNTVKNREEDKTAIHGPLIPIEGGPDTSKTFLPRTKSPADETGDQPHGSNGSTFITESFKERHGYETVAVNVSRVADRKAEKIRDTDIRSESFYGEASNLTVTIIAACVIGGILLIIVVGMLVRFMINKADPEHQMRQMHKKECVLRRNAKILNKGAKGKSFA